MILNLSVEAYSSRHVENSDFLISLMFNIKSSREGKVLKKVKKKTFLKHYVAYLHMEKDKWDFILEDEVVSFWKKLFVFKKRDWFCNGMNYFDKIGVGRDLRTHFLSLPGLLFFCSSFFGWPFSCKRTTCEEEHNANASNYISQFFSIWKFSTLFPSALFVVSVFLWHIYLVQMNWTLSWFGLIWPLCPPLFSYRPPSLHLPAPDSFAMFG